ncbi:uncharacterized protein LOC144590428 [Rhinoraja longicauda]
MGVARLGNKEMGGSQIGEYGNVRMPAGGSFGTGTRYTSSAVHHSIPNKWFTEIIKPALNPKFAGLCKTPGSEPPILLFGKDLPKKVKDLEEESKTFGLVRAGLGPSRPNKPRRQYLTASTSHKPPYGTGESSGSATIPRKPFRPGPRADPMENAPPPNNNINVNSSPLQPSRHLIVQRRGRRRINTNHHGGFLIAITYFLPLRSSDSE